MKVLFITRKYPPSVGGMELFAYELSKTLVDKIDLKLVKWSGSGRIRAVLIAIPYLFIKAKWTLLKGGIDVIHVHDGVLAPVGYVLSRLFRKPFVVVIHGLEATYRNPLFRAVVPAALRRASVVVCISQATAVEVTRLGVNKSKIQVVPLAVEDQLYGKSNRSELLKWLRLPSDSQMLLTVGRLVERKGVAWFIDKVLPRLVREHPKLVYLVVGAGKDRVNVEAAVKKSGIRQHVKLLGKVDDELYEAAYNGADVFVMPNIKVVDDMEGFGLVSLEAALCALPIVAADTEGIKDAIIDGSNGVRVPSGDATAFQHAINRFLNDKKYSDEFGRKSRRYTLEHYNWRHISERYVKVYEKLAN